MSTKPTSDRLPRTFIKEWRVFRYLTQQALVDKVGTSKSLISRYETGSFDMSTPMQWRIIEALQIRPDELWVRPIPTLKDEQHALRERAKFHARRKADLAE